MYKVSVYRGRKLVERNCFSDLKNSERHFAFLEHRYINEFQDFKVKITIKKDGKELKRAWFISYSFILLIYGTSGG